jgi:hypothetical protein
MVRLEPFLAFLDGAAEFAELVAVRQQCVSSVSDSAWPATWRGGGVPPGAASILSLVSVCVRRARERGQRERADVPAQYTTCLDCGSACAAVSTSAMVV